MIAAVATEFIKVRSTRLWWIMLGLLVVLGSGMTAMMAAISHLAGGTGGSDGAPVVGTGAVYSMVVGFGYVFTLIMGALSVTSEFRYQTITPTYLTDPRRGRVVAGKTVGQLVIGIAFGIAATVVASAVGAVLLSILGDSTGLGEDSVRRSLALSPLALGLWAVIGVGMGALIKNQIAAIVVIIGFNQIVDPVLRLVLALANLGGVEKFLPTAAAESVSGGGFSTLMATGSGSSLSWWAGGLVLLGYGIVFVVLGWLLTLRRDVS